MKHSAFALFRYWITLLILRDLLLFSANFDGMLEEDRIKSNHQKHFITLHDISVTHEMEYKDSISLCIRLFLDPVNPIHPDSHSQLFLASQLN